MRSPGLQTWTAAAAAPAVLAQQPASRLTLHHNGRRLLGIVSGVTPSSSGSGTRLESSSGSTTLTGAVDIRLDHGVGACMHYVRSQLSTTAHSHRLSRHLVG